MKMLKYKSLCLICNIFFFNALLFFPAALSAENIPSADSAAAAYAKGDFNKALDIYSLILEKGYHSANLYYNIGNCYYKIAQYPKAILFYEKALHLDPRNEDASYNLQMAQRFVVDKIDVLPEFFMRIWYKDLINAFPSDTWATNSVTSFLILLVLLAVFFYTPSRKLKKLTFTFAIIAFLYSSTTIVFSFSQKHFSTAATEAIIMTPSVTVKSTPDQGGTDLFLIHEGLKVTVIDQVDQWVEIKLANGSKGWIKESDISKI